MLDFPANEGTSGRRSRTPAPVCSLVVPVLNERANLEPLFEEIERALGPLAAPWELLLVDDGSTDGSLEIMRALAAVHPEVRVLHLPRNRGQSAAFAAGFRAARAAVVVTLDADLQNDPADIPRLLAAIEQADVVSGVRVERRDAWQRRAASRIANSVRRFVVGDSTTDVGCSLKAYRASWLAAVPMFDGVHRFLPGLLERRGARIVELPVGHRPRRHGVSKYTIGGRLGRGLLDLLGVRWLGARCLLDRDLRAASVRHEAAADGTETEDRAVAV